jgi:hypothetical protein
MMRRAALLLVAVLLAAPLLTSTANAQTFENDDDYAALCIPLQLQPNNTPTAGGDPFTVSGTAATGGATIAIVMDGSTLLGTTTSDASNHFFSASVQIPAGTSAGSHSIQAVQLGDDTDPIVGCPSSIAAINVLGLTIEQAPAEEPLARTGSNSTMPLARLGFGLLVAGGLAMLVSRKHKAKVTAAA